MYRQAPPTRCWCCRARVVQEVCSASPFYPALLLVVVRAIWGIVCVATSASTLSAATACSDVFSSLHNSQKLFLISCLFLSLSLMCSSLFSFIFSRHLSHSLSPCLHLSNFSPLTFSYPAISDSICSQMRSKVSTNMQSASSVRPSMWFLEHSQRTLEVGLGSNSMLCRVCWCLFLIGYF